MSVQISPRRSVHFQDPFDEHDRTASGQYGVNEPIRSQMVDNQSNSDYSTPSSPNDTAHLSVRYPAERNSGLFATAAPRLDHYDPFGSQRRRLEGVEEQTIPSWRVVGPQSHGIAPHLDGEAMMAVPAAIDHTIERSESWGAGSPRGTIGQPEVRAGARGSWVDDTTPTLHSSRSFGYLPRPPEPVQSPTSPSRNVFPRQSYASTTSSSIPPSYTPTSPIADSAGGRRSDPIRSASVGDALGSSTLNRGSSSRLEEGGGPRQAQGVFTNLLKLYGLQRGRLRSRSAISASNMGASQSRCDSLDSSFFPTARGLGGQSRSRCSSIMTQGEHELMDEYDPRVTGAKVNTIDQEKHAQATVETHAGMDKKKKKSAAIKYHISSVLARQTFILRLAKALMIFGSPSHRLEGQLKATAIVLDIEAEFVHMPNILVASFGDIDTKTSQTHFLKVNSVLQLGRLHNVHNIYRSVVHDEIGVEEATSQLNKLIRSKPMYGALGKTVLTSLCTALICPLAFGGSFLDMLIAGGEGALLSWLQFGVASKNALYSNVFEISIAIIMSFIARALASIRSRLFCYSAISSAGVVLVLPGYMILCSALELASKNIVSGSVKLVFAIVYSLFLGFGLTIGSDIYLLIDPAARAAQLALTEGLDQVVINGVFTSKNSTSIPKFAGTFTFSNVTATTPLPTNDIAGCIREASDPWYLQPFPLWSLFILVPAFSILSSVANGQPFKSKQLPIMVIISCLSFFANAAASRYIFNRSDVVSAIGAFVAGLLGNLYSRITKTGTSFTSMVTGVLFLVPAGIAATGGLSQNYRGQDGDEYSNGLIIGLRTVQVAIGITVGLFASSLFIYSFGRSKRGAIFAF